MSAAYYNENDLYAAQWLRNLIAAGLIAPGDVDDRSIEDVRPSDLIGYTQCHFFAGIGVWSYALRRAGWPDHRPVWTGSCPCQPFSAAGRRGGVEDKRHLWPTWHQNLIVPCAPVVVFGEQVASKDGLAWLDVVYADLEAADYAVRAVDLCAAGVGAPHIRQRLFFAAERGGLERLADARSGASERHTGNVPAAQTQRSGARQLDGHMPVGHQHGGAARSVAHAELPGGGGRVLSIEQTITMRSKKGRKVQVGLENVAALASWPTPITNDAEKRGVPKVGGAWPVQFT